MPDILHQVGIKAPPQRVFAALTEPKLLSKWWTKAKGESVAGSKVVFHFDDWPCPMKITALKQNKLIKWSPIDTMSEWRGTEIVFELHKDGLQTLVNFKHAKWKKQTEMMSHCTTKWAVYLLSLKDLLEKGRGKPYPRDIQVNHYTY